MWERAEELKNDSDSTRGSFPSCSLIRRGQLCVDKSSAVWREFGIDQWMWKNEDSFYSRHSVRYLCNLRWERVETAIVWTISSVIRDHSSRCWLAHDQHSNLCFQQIFLHCRFRFRFHFLEAHWNWPILRNCRWIRRVLRLHVGCCRRNHWFPHPIFRLCPSGWSPNFSLFHLRSWTPMVGWDSEHGHRYHRLPLRKKSVDLLKKWQHNRCNAEGNAEQFDLSYQHSEKIRSM